MDKDLIIVGIDGGASKVSAHVIDIDGNSFSLSNKSSTKEYKDYPVFQHDFKPEDLAIQLKQISDDTIELTDKELIQSKAYYSAFIDAIKEIASNKKVLIGIGMPGIKSKDERGIIAMANGPRMPNFTSNLEQKLADNDIRLAQPITKLGSDADYCGTGEEFAENGAFKAVENAYYLGGGTGAADAIKLHGQQISFDECKNWIAKTWELKDCNGKSMEDYCSANGIQNIYAELSNLDSGQFYINEILCKAQNGDNSAIKTYKVVAKNIAELLFERISTIYCGWQNNFQFINPNRLNLNKDHKYIGTLLDRIVIGQRLGELQAAKALVFQSILDHLSTLINNSEVLDEIARSHYLIDGKFRSDILVISQLRAAPALGAGIDAWNSYANN